MGRTWANGERSKEGKTVSKCHSVENDGGADGKLECGACTEELKCEKKEREKFTTYCELWCHVSMLHGGEKQRWSVTVRRK